MNATEFFDRYRRALLDRDAAALGRLYAVPALIVFPGTLIAVGDAAQTEAFFAASWGQYDGVTELHGEVEVTGTGPATQWVQVTWTSPGMPTERFCYQLVDTADGPRIAVLTLLDA